MCLKTYITLFATAIRFKFSTRQERNVSCKLLRAYRIIANTKVFIYGNGKWMPVTAHPRGLLCSSGIKRIAPCKYYVNYIL